MKEKIDPSNDITLRNIDQGEENICACVLNGTKIKDESEGIDIHV